jgi:hypothetical protein
VQSFHAIVPAPRLSPSGRALAACTLAKLGIHLATGAGYGYFCDELYQIALSRHLALGYVDLPPLVPALVALSRAALGPSLLAHHLVPALAGAGTLALVCLTARELGGRAFAVALAGLAFLVAPVWLILDSFFCYDSIDQLALAGVTWALARLLRTGDRRLWLLVGLLAGLAGLAKLTVLFLAPPLLLALLLSGRRSDLATRWPWLGLLVLLGLMSPYVYWQAGHGWPTLAYWGRYHQGLAAGGTPLDHLVGVALVLNPFAAPLALLGLVRIWRPFGGASFRLLGGLSVLGAALLAAVHGRAFMMAELFVPLIAAGAVWAEELCSRLRRPRPVQAAAVAWLVAAGALVAPYALPLLPTRLLPAYARHLGFLYQPIKDFSYQKNEYPQELANRIGWEELVAEVARVVRELSPEDRAAAGIFCDWYGPAGAVDLFGPRYGLPRAVSGHLNYHLWGPGENGWRVMILVTASIDRLAPMFDEVEEKAAIDNPFALPFNRNRIYLARGPRFDVAQAWPRMGPY